MKINTIKDLSSVNKIFCIGIGGIGISAVARILNQTGKQVSGSDIAESEITSQLEKEGINVFLSQESKNIDVDTDLIVYTVAVGEENPERQRADELSIPQLTYPQLLGILMQGRHGIGVSGTDGKTTTTAMLGKIFVDADADPTIVIGSKVSYLSGNSRLGESKYFIFESDEYGRAFHNYHPQVAALTNVRADHLDVYRDLSDVKRAFVKYLNGVQKDGLVIVNNDDDNSIEVATSSTVANKMTYAIENDADVVASDIRYESGYQVFSVLYKRKLLGEIKLVLPGRYNIYNALSAISIALSEGIDFSIIKTALNSFTGVWRRFEKIGKVLDTEIITDYAHTPEGLTQVIRATKELYKDTNVLFVFQPHQYNRTKNFQKDFVDALKTADDMIVSDIFYVEGRENPNDFDINSKMLAKDAGVEYGGDLKQTEKMVREKINDFDVIIFIGAGDIYNLSKKILIN